MGCDIHMIVEKRTDNGWFGIFTPTWKAGKACERSYVAFARLAGVRGAGPEPRGIPEDVSQLSQFWIDDWDTDGHHHSWIALDEAVALFKEIKTDEKFLDDYSLFGVETETLGGHPSDYRLIYWIDN